MIEEEREDRLVLRAKRTSRIIMGVSFVALGSLLLSVGFGQTVLSYSHVGRAIVPLVAVGFMLIGVQQLFNDRWIRVDGQKKEVIIHGRTLGLLSRQHVIPFAQIEGIQVLKLYGTGGAGRHLYWRVDLVDRRVRRWWPIDASSDVSYVNKIIDAMQRLISCKVAGSGISEHSPYVVDPSRSDDSA